MAAMTPREHIEEIRRSKFSIGGKLNPLTEDLHQAVRNLSTELYAKDVHFLMELIQNAEDNEYIEGLDPSLEFVITTKDITGTEALATLLIFNNEKGFSPRNIDSICSVGRSTKKGQRKQGYIGEKGIGFKSVFLITAQPYIFSNGYQIRFNEDPCPHCNLGYIVPEWVDDRPTLSDIKLIYGSDKMLPTTTIVLPLKWDKINPVKQQLSNMHPEVLLFLSKIKCLSVREDNEDPRLSTVSTIAISSETDFSMRKNIDAESYMLHLSAEENSDQSSNRQCSYYMWKQKFPVRPENKVERRMEVEEFLITLAFPIEERLHRGMNSPGVYAYLPTEMITNFPFIIQADFVLASSRETIQLDDKWNQGILNCVPSAFISAFTSLVKASESVPVSSLPPMFRFLPIQPSPYPKFNALIREAIRTKLFEEDIVPSESCTEQKIFHKPRDFGRLMPAFWSILKEARVQGVSLHNLSSHGKFILSSSFDSSEYDAVLDFLGVQYVGDEWYGNFIRSSNLVLEVSDQVYLELLLLISTNWASKFQHTTMKTLPLVKYVDVRGDVSLCSVAEATSNSIAIFLSSKYKHAEWLIESNREFRCRASRYFMPAITQVAVMSSPDKERVLEWLSTHVKVTRLDVCGYAVALPPVLHGDSDLVVAYAHFLYHSLLKDYISEADVHSLCRLLPLLDNNRRVITTRSGILIPGKGSKWVQLMGSNPWINEGYIELGEVYLKQGRFAGQDTPEYDLVEFLKKYVGASDIPRIHPPNSGVPTVSGPLTPKNALLLLDWIRDLKYKRTPLPDKFLSSIKEGSWLRTTVRGISGYRPPSQSFFPTSSWGLLFQNVVVLVDIPLIDQSFYGDKIIEQYKEELKTLGVVSEYGEACEYIGKHLMSIASSFSLTKSHVFSILQFIRYLREQYLPAENFIDSINRRSWLRTTHGIKSPSQSVLFDEGWKTAAEISDIPFVDKSFYGEGIYDFKEELRLLGVVVSLENRNKLIVDYLKPSTDISTLKPEAFLLMLQCIQCCTSTSGSTSTSSSNKIVTTLVGRRCLKTNLGYRSPAECFLPDPKWGCLLQVFTSIAVIDMGFYGAGILSYKQEMNQLSIVVNFVPAIKAFCETFRRLVSSSSITKENVVSFLACYRNLDKNHIVPSELRKCIGEVKWLRTQLRDDRSPKNCILFGQGWRYISQICRLPFLDTGYYGEEINDYEEELKSIGVVVKLQDGTDFVIAGLHLPTDVSRITCKSVLALLYCIRIFLETKDDQALPGAFLSILSDAWLKTHAGYLSPSRCCLYDPEWAPFLRPTDGPFIDEEFYVGIADFKRELSAIGVILDVKDACHLLAAHIYSHSDSTIILRIYNFLRHFNWEPNEDVYPMPRMRIWIPSGSGESGGEWVSPGECVIHDKDELFNSKLNVLDRHYEQGLLRFFVRAFRVKSNPSIVDYCQLWKEWEVSGHPLSQAECCAFWGYVVKHWNPSVEKMVGEYLTKLPVDATGAGAGQVLLSDRSDVFIADDLLLKDLFEQASPQPIFVWLPKRSLARVPRVKLLEIYRKIKVKTISQSATRGRGRHSQEDYKTVDPRDHIITRKGLVTLILGFLANPPINMEVEKRHEAIECLLRVEIMESSEPITLSYELPLSSGELVRGLASQMVLWEREASKLFTQKKVQMKTARGNKNLMEYAINFGAVISQGILWDADKEQMNALSELITLAYLVEFNEEAVESLMKSRNLQVYEEDVEFLSSSILGSTSGGSLTAA